MTRQENNRWRIGLDLGTSAIKGVLVDADEHPLATAEAPVSYNHPHDGWGESDAHRWLGQVHAVIEQLTAAAPGPVGAMACAAAAGSTLLADADGAPLTPVISWMDRRCVGAVPEAIRELTPRSVRQVTGWPGVETFPLAHLAWLRENRPDVYTRADRVCMDIDWLMFQLTGQWVLDRSTATTFHLQDQLRGRYHRPYLDRLGIPESKLSRLADSGIVAGPVTPDAATRTGLTTATQVVTGCFDHPAAARAVGVCRPGQLMLSCGTSWVGFFPEANRQRIIDAELLCDPFLSDRAGPWGAMFSIPYIGRTIDAYVRDVIAPGEADHYATFNRLAADAPAGAGGLRIDLRRPVQPIHDAPPNVSRAVMEAAAELVDGLSCTRCGGKASRSTRPSWSADRPKAPSGRASSPT